MTTLNLQCAESADDASQGVGTGDTFIGGSIIILADAGRNGNNHVGLRFPNVFGMAGAEVTAAILTFSPFTSDSGSFIGDWYAEDSASPPVFVPGSSNFDISARVRTTVTCEGDGSDFGNWTVGVDVTFIGDGTVTIEDIIQKLLDDGHDPSAIVLLFIYTSGGGERVLRTLDFDTALAPKLDIDFDVGGGPIITGAAAVSGVGSMAVVGSSVLQGQAAITGIGTASAAGIVGEIHLGQAVVTGVGSASAVAVMTLGAFANIAGEGLVDAIGQRIVAGQAIIQGVGSVSAIGELTTQLEGRASILGVGTVTVVGQRIAPAAASIVGIGTLVAVGQVTAVGVAAIAGVGAMSVIADSGVFIFTVFGAIRRLIDPADYPVGVAIALEVQFSSPVGSETKARLFNITDAVVVAGSELSTSSTTTVRLRTSALTLAAGAKEYRIEFAGQSGDIYNVVSADVIPVSG